ASTPGASSSPPSVDAFRHFLADLHLEKFRAIGVSAVDRGVVAAIDAAHRADVSDPLGRNTWVVLSYMIGSGFASDPLYPWAQIALSASLRSDRSALLFAAAKRATASALNQLRTAATA